jgi:hypothetical protein
MYRYYMPYFAGLFQDIQIRKIVHKKIYLDNILQSVIAIRKYQHLPSCSENTFQEHLVCVML